MDKLSNLFDIEPVKPERLPVPKTNGSEQVTSDSEFARTNLKQLIETSRTALQHALNVAVQSDSPRAYEVLANLINTSADLNTKLIDVHQREQKLSANKEDDQKVTNNVTNNVLFTGTTSELNDMIMKRMTNK